MITVDDGDTEAQAVRRPVDRGSPGDARSSFGSNGDVPHAAQDASTVSDRLAMDALSESLVDQADIVKQTAIRCDTMCLNVGAKLCEAVPTLSALSGQFSALSTTLQGDDLSDACATLETVAQKVAAIGVGLSIENQTLAQLVALNGTLSRRIVNVSDDIRFLAAMITSVKVESASIQDETEGLQGFAQTLASLTDKAQTTIERYFTMHSALLRQLRTANRLQNEFEISRKADLISVAEGIEESLATISARRTAISAAATDVGHATQRIASQIGQCVVALQIGDTTRQRIEHVGDTLTLLSAAAQSIDNPLTSSLGRAIAVPELWLATNRICNLQAQLLEDAGQEFASEIEVISTLLSQLGQATSDLTRMSSSIFGSDGSASASFLGDLETKLKTTHRLLEEYQQSRAAVDGMTEAVIATFIDLEHLGASVAAMVIDMTIIGTNAIVKSYRLGQRGAGLSIIAQHLRIHALRIADGIKLLTPALKDALNAARAFTQSLVGQDAAHMAALGRHMSDVLQTFDAAGTKLGSAIQHLEGEADGVGHILSVAFVTLREIDHVKASLDHAAEHLIDAADAAEPLGAPSHAIDQAIDAYVRPRYTMATERQIHDAFFGPDFERSLEAGTTEASQAGRAFDTDDALDELML